MISREFQFQPFHVFEVLFHTRIFEVDLAAQDLLGSLADQRCEFIDVAIAIGSIGEGEVFAPDRKYFVVLGAFESRLDDFSVVEADAQVNLGHIVQICH